MKRMTRFCGGLAAVGGLIATVALAASPAQAHRSVTAAANGDLGTTATNVGTSFKDRLFPDQYIYNNGYRLHMQSDGNLVLYAAHNRACWASGTNGIRDVYADYDDSLVSVPYMKLKSPYGTLRTYNGAYTWTHKTGNVSINSRGEVWIAYKKFVNC